jgi:Dirigent-like protein
VRGRGYDEGVRLIALSGVAALVLAAGASARPGATIIRVVSIATAAKTHDAPPKGPSKGDYVVIDDKLTNQVAQFGRKKGALVGTDHAVERNIGSNRVMVDGIARLPGGTIHFKGELKVDTNGIAGVKVVGGTGDFQSAKGVVAIKNLTKDGKVALNVYSITLLPTA